jgi:hypothetical protein
MLQGPEMARPKTVLSRAQRELLGALAANRDYSAETERRIEELIVEARAMNIPLEEISRASGWGVSTIYDWLNDVG